MSKVRVALRLPDGTTAIMTYINYTPSEAVDRIREHKQFHGAQLVCIHQLPDTTDPVRVRFCPYCGTPLDEDDAPPGQGDVVCPECENNITVILDLYDVGS